MFEQLANTVYNPLTALIVYKLNTQDSRYPAYFIQKHTVLDGIIREGRPLKRKELLDICSTVMPHLSEKAALIPENLLFHSSTNGIMMWWTPAQKRRIHFHKTTDMPSGEAPLPALLFLVRNTSLTVWALRENRRPGPSTMIFSSPFYNTTSNGTCMGNIRTPDKTNLQDIPLWERLFFNSYFTLEGAPRFRKADARELWKELTTGRYGKFPLRFLSPWGKLERIITNINQEN